MLPLKAATVARDSQPTVTRPDNASTKPSKLDRLHGALVCSIEAAWWMMGAFLWFTFWAVKLTLMVGFAMLRLRVK